MESRFGFDFARVRVHTDAQAASAAAGIGARAFTVGQDVYFGARYYAPETLEGRRLLAHELAHTVQQREAQGTRPPIPMGSPLEAAAERASQDVASGRAVTGALGVSGRAVARAPLRPTYLDAEDELLEDEARGARLRLKHEADGPDRAEDLKMVSEIATELERRVAVRESEKTLAAIGVESADEEEPPTPVPMELSSSSTPGPKRSPATSARSPRPGQSPPSRFAPMGFTDADLYGPMEEDAKRFASEFKQFHATDRPSFSDRFYRARREAAANDEFTAESTWDRGVNEGLFVEDDRWAFDAMWEEKLGKPARQEARHNANVESARREMAWEDKGDEITHSVQTGIFQAIAFGELGWLPGTAYEAYTDVDMAKQTVEAVRSGKAENIIGAGIQLGGVAVMHQVTGGASDTAAEHETGNPVLSSQSTGLTEAPLAEAAHDTGAQLGGDSPVAPELAADDLGTAVADISTDVVAGAPGIGTSPQARAVALRARHPKLDGSPASMAGLTDIYRRAGSGGRSVARRPGEYLPKETRAASGELRKIAELIDNPDVVQIRVLPQQYGPHAPRTPDLEADFRQPDGSIVTEQIEVRTQTGARANYQPVGQGGARVTTAGEIAGAVRAKLSRGQLTGGTLVVDLPRAGAGGLPNVQAAMARLVQRLRPASNVRAVEFALPSETVRYVRGTDGLYRTTESAPQ